MKDLIVEEIQKYRMEHTRKFRGDLSEICNDLQDIQISSGHLVVGLAPIKLEPTKQSSRLRRIGG